MRVALYWAPEIHDPLHAAGSAWLGRDAETGAIIPPPAPPELATLTADARRYGFHATLRPPMRLSTSWEQFRTAAIRLAAATTPFTLPPLAVTGIDGFLALTTAAPCPEMQALADICVRETEPHRAAPDAAELARRRAAGLTPRQESLLRRFGYPYVMQEWRFHMTLSGRLSPADMMRLKPAAMRHFDGTLTARDVTELCLFTQAPNESFLIAERFRLGALPLTMYINKEESASF